MLAHFTKDASGLASQDFSVVFDDDVFDNAIKDTDNHVGATIEESHIEASRFAQNLMIFNNDDDSSCDDIHQQIDNAQSLLYYHKTI